MNKFWFDYLGKYDMDMDIWGGENFGELLFLRFGVEGGIFGFLDCMRLG